MKFDDKITGTVFLLGTHVPFTFEDNKLTLDLGAHAKVWLPQALGYVLTQFENACPAPTTQKGTTLGLREALRLPATYLEGPLKDRSPYLPAIYRKLLKYLGADKGWTIYTLCALDKDRIYLGNGSTTRVPGVGNVTIKEVNGAIQRLHPGLHLFLGRPVIEKLLVDDQ